MWCVTQRLGKEGRKVKYCSKCGETVRDNSVYCSKCGSYLQIKENISIQQEVGKFCCICGESINNQYCGACGSYTQTIVPREVVEKNLEKKEKKRKVSLKKKKRTIALPKLSLQGMVLSIAIVLVAAVGIGHYVDRKVLEPKRKLASSQWVHYTQDGKIGFKDENGNIKIEAKYVNAGTFSKEGLTKVIGEDYLWGYMNYMEEMVIEPKFEGAGDFGENGLAKVCVNGKYGYIDQTGNYVIKPKYLDAGDFGESGLAKVCVNEKYGYIDQTGNYVIKPKYLAAGDFGESGLAYVKDEGQQYGYIDGTGAYKIVPQYVEAFSFSKNGLARVNEGEGKYGFINTSGKCVIDAQKQENRVSVDVVCCTHPIYFKQYVTQVQYLKLEFSVEQEPELKEIQVRVCNSEGNSFTKAKASSVCGEQRNAVSENKEICYYKAENVVDEDETTAWIEGDKKGYGKGEWISLSATKKKKICGIAIRNGYTKSDRTMERNAQVKKVTVTCSDGSSQVYKLQKNTYATGVEKWYSDCILFEQPVDAKKITLTIESVYKGKRFYEYWDEGKEYYSQNSIACKDTCISEIKVLTMPEDDLYEAEEIKVVQEEENHYDSWQQAYLQALEQPQNVMARYNENMKLYVDEYKSLQGTLDQRYNEEGMLHLPNSGFLEDINGDSVPELFLIHATESPEDNEGIFAECVAHVFTFDMKDKCRLYCGSFVTRYDENEGEETFFYKDQRDDSLRAYLSYGVGEAEGTHYYSFFGLKENKLAWNKLLEWKQTIKRDNSSITIRCRKKDYLSITKEEFEQEYENDARYLTRVELLTLEELEECVQ